ncbi:MAG: alpha,alpha-trehalase [Bacteroidales bacterium]|nr:alpha,alpha-trehalase [Bacteroidales bacterium]
MNAFTKSLLLPVFYSISSISICLFTGCSNIDEEVANVRTFIRNNWDKTLEYHPTDTGTLIGLPYPYTVPTISNESIFRELYYWDIYFTNIGLIIDGKIDLARNNTDNILYLVNRFGKMPNGSRTYYLNRSQPPYLSMMVFEMYKITGDKGWLENAVQVLEKEYQFWMAERITSCGLNRYSSSAGDDYKIKMAEYLKKRFKDNVLIDTLTQQQKIAKGGHHTAEAESGWDFTPRFLNRCEDFCPIDLNSYLFIYEKNFAWFYEELGQPEKIQKWIDAANRRNKLINSYCYNSKDGLFYDYDFVNNQQSPVISTAMFTTLFAELASQEQAETLVGSLHLLETKFGVAACRQSDYHLRYQWGPENGWAPVHYLVIKGLLNYGFENDADRIAGKFIDLVVENYQKTHNLWEKYNIMDGSTNTVDEYEMPAFLGWTAGVFNFCAEIKAPGEN